MSRDRVLQGRERACRRREGLAALRRAGLTSGSVGVLGRWASVLR